MPRSEALEFLLETLCRLKLMGHERMWDIVEEFYVSELNNDHE